MKIIAAQNRQWHWVDAAAAINWPWVSYANNGMSYGMSEDRKQFALLDNISWNGISGRIEVMLTSEDLRICRDKFFDEQRARQRRY